MQKMDEVYQCITEIFQAEVDTFAQRRHQIQAIAYSSCHWSNAWLNFFPYESALQQLPAIKIYPTEKVSSIRNHYCADQLVFACHSDHESWGCVFVEDEQTHKKWMKFIENEAGEIRLQHLKVMYLKDNRCGQVISYSLDQDEDEESLAVYDYVYLDNKLQYIEKHGFYQSKAKILPVQKYELSIHTDQVHIHTKDHRGMQSLIYRGPQQSVDWFE